MRVLVTGAAGFIGKALCAALMPNHQVYGTTRQANAELVPGVIPVIWSGNVEALNELPQLDAVLHLVARVHVMDDRSIDPLMEFRAANVELTRDLAQWAASRRIRRFIFLSSIKVHGESTQPGEVFSAGDILLPEDAYAVSKLEAEQILSEVCRHSDLEFVVIRPPLVYGPGVRGNFRALMRWVQKGVPLPFGSVDNQRSLVALDNLIDLIRVCLTHPAAANQVFLVADERPVSTSELLIKIGRAYGRSVRLFSVPPTWLRRCAAALGKTGVAERLLGSLVVDSTKARDLLGWHPVVSMEEQLRKMVGDDPRS